MKRSRLVIAGTASGVGKTSIALGLVRALSRKGRTVQPFKVGPDYLDPQFLTRAAGTPCYNLDTWMMGPEHVRGLCQRASERAAVLLVEGVMGLYDGASPDDLAGSTAEAAIVTDSPVLLVVDARGMGQSIAAVVKGYAELSSEIRVAGVIANRIGSPRHREILKQALEGNDLPPLVGAVPRDALPQLPSRHLGLKTMEESEMLAVIDQIADAVEEHIDLAALETLAACEAAPGREAEASSGQPVAPVRLGIARDKAFYFYYQDNLEALVRHGCELVPFSPLTDPQLPEGLDGVYLGGGYPEEFAAEISGNRTLLADLKAFAASGKAVYAECGGLMCLGEALVLGDGREVAMAGVIPLKTAMLPKRRALGYVEASLLQESFFGPVGTRVRGHEFHYSEIRDCRAGNAWQPAFDVPRRVHGGDPDSGFCKAKVLASYLHIHFAADQEAVRHFVAWLRKEER